MQFCDNNNNKKSFVYHWLHRSEVIKAEPNIPNIIFTCPGIDVESFDRIMHYHWFNTRRLLMDIQSISIKGRSPNKGFAIFHVRTKDVPEKYGSVITNAKKMKFFIKDLFSMWDQIHSFLQVWSHLLEKSFMKLHFLSSAVS